MLHFSVFCFVIRLIDLTHLTLAAHLDVQIGRDDHKSTKSKTFGQGPNIYTHLKKI